MLCGLRKGILTLFVSYLYEDRAELEVSCLLHFPPSADRTLYYKTDTLVLLVETERILLIITWLYLALS